MHNIESELTYCKTSGCKFIRY